MSNLRDKIDHLAVCPAAWMGFSEETRHAIKQAATEAATTMTKRFDPLTGETYID